MDTLQDLLRQLHQTRKRLEQYEQNHVPSERDSLSVGSRTSSTGSLDTLGNSGHPGTNQGANSSTNSAAVSCHNAITHQVRLNNVFTGTLKFMSYTHVSHTC